MNTKYPSENEMNQIEIIRSHAEQAGKLFEVDFSAAKLELEGYTSLESYKMAWGK
jgi:hypothetical protein